MKDEPNNLIDNNEGHNKDVPNPFNENDQT